MSSQIKSFGCMTTNIAAAIGIKTAIQTTNTATKTLDQECRLQKEQAKMLGGIGEDSGHGLIAMELDTQITSANEAGQAIQDEAFGALASGIVAGIGTGVSVGAFKFAGKDEDMETELSNAESFKSELNDGNEEELEIGEENEDPVALKTKLDDLDQQIQEKRDEATKQDSQYAKLCDEAKELADKKAELSTDSPEYQRIEAAEQQKIDETIACEKDGDAIADAGDALCQTRDETQAKYDTALKNKMAEDARISKWLGNDPKEPDFSNFKKDSDKLSTEEKLDQQINKRALARVKSDPNLKTEVSHNIDRTILRLKQRITDARTQKQNSVINLLSQGTNSGSSIAKSGGDMGQAAQTRESQTDSAYASLIEKAMQATSQQAGAAAQQASSIQGEIANTLQNIAFPA